MGNPDWCIVAGQDGIAAAERYRTGLTGIGLMVETVIGDAPPSANRYLYVGVLPTPKIPPGRSYFVYAGALPDVRWIRMGGKIVAETTHALESLGQNGISYPNTFYAPSDSPDLIRRFVWGVTGDRPTWLDDGYRPESDIVCISMPESIARRRRFENIRPDGCSLFPGLRHRIPWVGGAMSFRALARGALAAGMDRLTIMEDDVELPGNYAETATAINSHLDGLGDWHLFAGLVLRTGAGRKVLSRELAGDVEFLTLNHFAGMAYCIFSRAGLEALAGWNPEGRGVDNLIDVYLSGLPDLRVITAVPYLFGLADERSTQWRGDNSRYRRMAAKCERALSLTGR